VLRGPFGHPALKLVSDGAQRGPCHRKDLSIRIEEADDPLRLLERLDQPIEQNDSANGCYLCGARRRNS
jgi:hypothetical protein